MKSTKNQKVYVLHYSIDIDINIYTFKKKKKRRAKRNLMKICLKSKHDFIKLYLKKTKRNLFRSYLSF